MPRRFGNKYQLAPDIFAAFNGTEVVIFSKFAHEDGVVRESYVVLEAPAVYRLRNGLDKAWNLLVGEALP